MKILLKRYKKFLISVKLLMKKVVAVINNGTANIKNAARILFRDKLLQFWIPPMGRVEPH